MLQAEGSNLIRGVCCRRCELEISFFLFLFQFFFFVLYYFQDRLVRYGWRCDVKYIGSWYSIGIAGGDNGVFRDFEGVSKDIVLLRLKS